jgi:glutamine synthetase
MKKKVKLEYVWLDGYTPEPNLRSKVKVIDIDENHRIGLDDCPMWSLDGSSTKQAEGHFSDCILKPVRLYENYLNKGYLSSYFVMCEV